MGNPRMSKPLRFLVLQHADVEHPGSMREFMREGGHSCVTVELDAGDPIPTLDGFDAMLVMGGPMDTWQEDLLPWLIAEKTAIRTWVGAGRPYLGICLGAQLLADAMGGQVALMPEPEVGLGTVDLTQEGTRDPLLRGVAATSTCFQWHGAEVTSLPPQARLIVTGTGCRVQAFAVGERAYGLQYHLELTESAVREWGALSAYVASLERAMGVGAMPALEREIAGQLPVLRAAAKQVFDNFVDIAQRAQS